MYDYGLDKELLMKYTTNEYDEEEQLTEYIFHNYLNLLNEVEHLANRAFIAEWKAQATDSKNMAEALRKNWGSPDDPRVLEEMQDGYDEFLVRIRNRILSRHSDIVFVNRCPSCQSIVATPKAQQCRWCGHDWHIYAFQC
ncbi:MAG TPA: hypothetical protein DD473_03740 [Planctomycetaceae bacterium]|nr:hypothetical protein [Planctomycetaceae bacterium]